VMASSLMTAVRFIAAAVVGYGVAYMWSTIRVEDDITILAGVGIGTTLMTFVLLYMFGKGSGS
jgi:hypothetical protein